MPLKHLRVSGAACSLVLVALSGCRDDIAPPTQGFLRVQWNEASQVQVFIDGELAGVDVGVVGPIDSGLHSVMLVRDGYLIEPAEGMQVSVAAAETTLAHFILTAQEFGSVLVLAEDELTGEEIEGAEVFRETSPGVFSTTGLFTPALLEQLPVGPTRIRVQKAGFELGAPTEVGILIGTQVDVRPILGPLNATLLEMFTYVICPNCPQAADTLEVLHEELSARAYVIEWHSWANLPLYDPRWKAREVYYTDGATVGYPATTIGGQLPLLVGAQTSELTQYRAQVQSELSQCGGDCPIALRLEGTIGPAAADLTARIKWRGGALPGNLKLRFVLIENEVPSPGNDTPFGFVARDMTEIALSFSAPPEIVAHTSSIPFQAWPYSGSPPHYQAIAFIQSDDTKEILQVSGLP